jgi:hypothetical protein
MNALSGLNSYHNRVRTDVVLDLVSTRGGSGIVILHLGYLGHSSWRPDGIDARRGLNLTKTILAPYMLEAKLCMVVCVVRRSFIENDGEQKHAIVVAADD